MLTVHTGTGNGLSVAVRDDRIEAVGPPGELAARYPDARLREWAGTLRAAAVLPGELPPAPSPRERVHAVLRLGATAVRAHAVDDTALRTAAVRAGLRVLADDTVAPELAPDGRADLAVFGPDGGCLATVLAGRVVHRTT